MLLVITGTLNKQIAVRLATCPKSRSRSIVAGSWRRREWPLSPNWFGSVNAAPGTVRAWDATDCRHTKASCDWARWAARLSTFAPSSRSDWRSVNPGMFMPTISVVDDDVSVRQADYQPTDRVRRLFGGGI